MAGISPAATSVPSTDRRHPGRVAGRAAVVLEAHHQLVPARRQRLVGAHDGQVAAVAVVGVRRTTADDSTATSRRTGRPARPARRRRARGRVELDRDPVRPVLRVRRRLLGQPPGLRAEGHRRAAVVQVEAAGDGGVLALGDPVVEREHLVLSASSVANSSCSSASRSGRSAARSWAWVQSRGRVVQLPHVVVEGPRHRRRPSATGRRAGSPRSSPRGRSRGCRPSRSTACVRRSWASGSSKV